MAIGIPAMVNSSENSKLSEETQRPGKDNIFPNQVKVSKRYKLHTLQIYLQGVIFHSAEGQRAATAKRVLLAYNAMPIEACAAS